MFENYFNEFLNEVSSEIQKNYDNIENIISELLEVITRGNKILVCGNGGSAADSQHFVAELVVRFKRNGKPIPAIALTTDTSILTACGNDFGFDEIFVRQVEALVNPGDAVITISTSGKSPNIIKVFDFISKNEKLKDVKQILFTSYQGKKHWENFKNIKVIGIGKTTSHVQEIHEMILHYIADRIEQKIRK